MISAKLVAYTQPTIEVGASDPEQFISYAARVSNPSNQENWDTAEGLLKYCIRNKHWSIFSMANAVVEIEAPRDLHGKFLGTLLRSFKSLVIGTLMKFGSQVVKYVCKILRIDKTVMNVTTSI